MDKAAIKKFAVWARRKLIEDIKQRAYEIEVRPLTGVEVQQRESLINKIQDKGYENVIEEVAYTWFNRFIALRFMEVNDYISLGIRVMSSAEPGKKEPDIIGEALNTVLELDQEYVYKLQDACDTESLYRYLLVQICNSLNDSLPGLFEEIEGYTEILLPSNLLAEGSVIRELVESIAEEDFQDQVEIIGWMYQYYLTEKKDQIFEGLKHNIKIDKENIPAATQLFTPDWIVKFMLENSLGRLWLEGHPDKLLESQWTYYLEEVEQDSEVRVQMERIRAKSRELGPENIKVLDPAMGSGHILVYAFDVLCEIYKSAGYAARDIPMLILKNNLYGLDIDNRAAQLAYFAVMMKARSKSRKLLNQSKEEEFDLNVCAIQESNGISKDALDFFLEGAENELKSEIEYLIDVFQYAKEYGAILKVKPVDFEKIEQRLNNYGYVQLSGRNREISVNIDGSNRIIEWNELSKFLRIMKALLKQARIISGKYDVVCTNPPYMGSKGMNNQLLEYLKRNYPNSKSDLFAAFMERGFAYLKEDSFNSMVTMQSWMFLSSFEGLRKKIINNYCLRTVLHMDNMVMGIAFGTAAAVMRNSPMNYQGQYLQVSLKDLTEKGAPKAFPVAHNKIYVSGTDRFKLIPGMPVAYWVTGKTTANFKEGKLLGDIASVRQGIATGNNDVYLKSWFEIDYNKIGFHCHSIEDFHNQGYLYAPYNKGGKFRKWYGNHEVVIKFNKQSYDRLATVGNHLPSKQFYFKSGITYTFVSSSSFGVRYSPEGFVFDVAGSTVFLEQENLYYILGFLSSKIAINYLNIINPTLNYQVGDLKKLPIIFSMKYKTVIEQLVQQNITLAKADWESFETSWSFRKHPLLDQRDDSNTLENAFANWAGITERRYGQLKANEQELSRLFIEIYGLQEELTPEVEDKDVTIRKADAAREVKSFISYAVGCMLGRYSVDSEGLNCAGGKINSYDNKVKNTTDDDFSLEAGDQPKEEKVLLILDDEYFENDIVSRFIQFLKASFSEEKFDENINFIAEKLGRRASETSRQTIRRYFLKEFYKDHVQIYQKKPIYWLFDSGKEDGFKALIYMHRYDENTVAMLRTDYFHKVQRFYETEVKRMDLVIDSSASEWEKTNAGKKKAKVLKQIEECLLYDQILGHIAGRKIEIELDDGVTINYAKFQGVEMPRGESRRPFKADLLARI